VTAALAALAYALSGPIAALWRHLQHRRPAGGTNVTPSAHP